MRRRCLFFVHIILLALVLSGTATAQSRPTLRELGPDQPGEDEDLNRELWESIRKTPYANALRHVASVQRAAPLGPPADVMLPNGWRIAPAGRQVEVGRFPCEVTAYAGQIVVLNTGYYSKEPQEVSIVSPDYRQVVKVLRLPSLFPSAQAGPDGDLYISGGVGQKIYRFNRRFEAVREYPVKGYAAGLAAVDSTHLAVAYMVSSDSQASYEKGNYDQGKLAILNTVTGEVEREVTAGYFPHTVRYLNGKLYVTLLGENKLQVYSAQLRLLKSLEVGQTPQDICSDSERLYVVNTGSDNLSVVDAQTDSVVPGVEMHNHESRFGSAPASCAVEGDRLYVTQTNTNAVAVFSKSKNRLLGLIPTGWYPTKVILQDKQALVLSAKGIHARRPNVDGPQAVPEKGGSQYVLTLLKGSLSIIPRTEVEAKLAVWTRQVEDGSALYGPRQGFKLPIRHIFYIVRENRTYDQVLGDSGKGNGDPFLTLFGREVTPNGHRLADEFVTLDNYYADGEISVLGHSFTTSGYASPFLEWLGNAQYSGRYTGYPFGMVPAVTSPRYLWDALDDKGIDYRIYGENYFLYTRAYRIIREAYGPDSELARKFYARMMSLAPGVDRGNAFYEFAAPFYGQAGTPEDALRLLEKPDFVRALSMFLCGDETLSGALIQNTALRRRFADYLYRYPSNYRSWDLTHSDLQRAQEWKADFEKQLQAGRVAQLSYIWLPNDHTGGADKRYLPPDQLVAQNDAALGRIIETIAQSSVWKDSLILVTEDDAQNGPDHVDATRTVALAVGPYVRRNAVVSDRYDQLSLLRTIELLLGLDPLNMNDTLAVPMFNIFTTQPNNLPYTPSPPSEHLGGADRRLYQALGNGQ